MLPKIELNWLAIGLVVVSNFVIGMIWYGPLFVKPWAKELGLDMSKKPETKVMVRAFALMIVGSLLTAFVLAHDVQVWQPERWNAGANQPPYVYGFFAGFFVWVGFQVPLLFNSMGWEGKSFKLFAINAGHQFVALQAAAMILAYVK